jgi:hypothetical protein
MPWEIKVMLGFVVLQWSVGIGFIWYVRGDLKHIWKTRKRRKQVDSQSV